MDQNRNIHLSCFSLLTLFSKEMQQELIKNFLNFDRHSFVNTQLDNAASLYVQKTCLVSKQMLTMCMFMWM